MSKSPVKGNIFGPEIASVEHLGWDVTKGTMRPYLLDDSC